MELFYAITGFILLGETQALIIGVFWVKKGLTAWNINKNRYYLITDGFSGLVLMLNYFFYQQFWFVIIVSLLTILSIVTHYYRIIEYVFKKNRMFCANKTMFYLNNLILILLFGVLFMLLPF